MCVKCTRNITPVNEMCLVETCQVNGSSPFNVPDMFLPVSRCLRPQCQSIRESIIRQGHSILAHLGGHKTVTYLREQVWWKTMVRDITDYCKSCPVCTASKSPTEKPRGLLKTMPVPTHPWQYIGIDFVGSLPESSNRNGSYDVLLLTGGRLRRQVPAGERD